MQEQHANSKSLHLPVYNSSLSLLDFFLFFSDLRLPKEEEGESNGKLETSHSCRMQNSLGMHLMIKCNICLQYLCKGSADLSCY